MKHINAQIDLIRERLKVAQSRQKSYANKCQRKLEFEVEGHVFLKVSPIKGIMRFSKKGRLSPWIVGLFEILERIGEVAFCIVLTPQLENIHNIFHVYMLRKPHMCSPLKN